MGRARIDSHLGDGQYNVTLLLAGGSLEAQISRLQTEIAAIEEQLTGMVTQLLDAESAFNDAAVAFDLAVAALETPPTPAQRSAWEQAQADLIEAQEAFAALRSQEQYLTLRKTSREKRLESLQSVPVEVTTTAWASDYALELSGEVGTIERGRTLMDPPVIYPDKAAGNAAYDAARDGQVAPTLGQIPAAAMLDYIQLPGADKWLPRYRFGEITALAGNVATVQLDPFVETHQNLNVNQSSTVDAPIEYMNCNEAVFQVGDRVVVAFTGQAWGNPKVIGFESNPKRCEEPFYYYWIATTVGTVSAPSGVTIGNTYTATYVDDTHISLNGVSFGSTPNAGYCLLVDQSVPKLYEDIRFDWLTVTPGTGRVLVDQVIASGTQFKVQAGPNEVPSKGTYRADFISATEYDNLALVSSDSRFQQDGTKNYFRELGTVMYSFQSGRSYKASNGVASTLFDKALESNYTPLINRTYEPKTPGQSVSQFSWSNTEKQLLAAFIDEGKVYFADPIPPFFTTFNESYSTNYYYAVMMDVLTGTNLAGVFLGTLYGHSYDLADPLVDPAGIATYDYLTGTTAPVNGVFAALLLDGGHTRRPGGSIEYAINYSIGLIDATGGGLPIEPTTRAVFFQSVPVQLYWTDQYASLNLVRIAYEHIYDQGAAAFKDYVVYAIETKHPSHAINRIEVFLWCVTDGTHEKIGSWNKTQSVRDLVFVNIAKVYVTYGDKVATLKKLDGVWSKSENDRLGLPNNAATTATRIVRRNWDLDDVAPWP